MDKLFKFVRILVLILKLFYFFLFSVQFLLPIFSFFFVFNCSSFLIFSPIFGSGVQTILFAPLHHPNHGFSYFYQEYPFCVVYLLPLVLCSYSSDLYINTDATTFLTAYTFISDDISFFVWIMFLYAIRKFTNCSFYFINLLLQFSFLSYYRPLNI